MIDSRDERSRLECLFDELWPITRSITGPGLRESLEIISREMPLELESVPSGCTVFDWKIPEEWRIKEARLTGPDGSVYADLDETNLAVLNYSEPVDRYMSLEELEDHLYTDPHHPNATPYATSYYERNWGFCLPHATYQSLPEGKYHAYIDSEFVDGKLDYGHTTLDGESDREFLLSTYLCHPSLANNELSSPLVMTSLYRRLREWDRRVYTYRFVVVPETIGSIAYLSRYGDLLKEKLAGGLVLTCLGGPEDNLSYKVTRRGDALIDEVVRHVDNATNATFRFREFDPATGSDERQYCSPGLNLPVGQFARTVYGEYDGYHNSLDSKDFMGIDSLLDSAKTIERILRVFEYGGYYRNTNPNGEPMLSKRDLYSTVNSPDHWSESAKDKTYDQDQFVAQLMRLLNYSDGRHPVVDIAGRFATTTEELVPAIEKLQEVGLLEEIPNVPPYNNQFEASPQLCKE